MNGSAVENPVEQIERIIAHLRRNKPTSMTDLNETLLRLRQNLIKIPSEAAKSYKEQIFNILWFQAYAARNVQMLEEALEE